MAVLKGMFVLVLILLIGCHKADSEANCSIAQEKVDVLATARSYYLWDTELPTTVDPAAYSTAPAFLDALTAQPRAEGKDRHFSYMSTREEQDTYFDQGLNQGYGFGFTTIGSQLFVVQVFPGSGAAAAGFARGDEVLAIATSQAGLDSPDAQASAIVAAGSLSTLLNSATPGTTRWFRLKPAAGGAQADVSATTGVYSLDPVPNAAAPVILDAGNGHKVGYLMLRTFVETAPPLLRTALGAFRQAGVTDLIVDLRYNGGGRLDVAEVMTNLLRAGHAGDLMYRMAWNGQHSANTTTTKFGAEANALAPGRIAFIVTGSTASASELVINALQPYLGTSLALVGSRTYGKPVGQVGFANSGCDWVLMLISVQLFNAQGSGSYFQGLPDAGFLGTTVAASDDLAHAPGNPAEASTAAALAWIAGTAPANPIASADARPTRSPRFLQPRPSEAQRNLPGVF